MTTDLIDTLHSHIYLYVNMIYDIHPVDHRVRCNKNERKGRQTSKGKEGKQ